MIPGMDLTGAVARSLEVAVLANGPQIALQIWKPNAIGEIFNFQFGWSSPILLGGVDPEIS